MSEFNADKVNPSHYKLGNIDAIDYTRALLSPEEFRGYLKGNIYKYTARAGKKQGEPAEDDHAKASWFLERLKHYFPEG